MRAPASHRLIRLLAGLGLAGALVLPALAVPARAADEKLVLRVGATQEAESLNPFAIITVSGYEVFQLTYNLMVDFGPNLEPVPGFADKWERAADGKSWTFHIREGMKWSDGQPATAQDACYSWGIALAANLAGDYIGEGYLDPGLSDAGVTKIECPDDQTLIAYTDDGTDRILQTYIPILPKHIWADTDYKEMGEATFTTPLVGTGPYVAVEFQTSQFVRFERNPYYWGTQGAADEVVIQFFKSDDTMVQALKAGEIVYARGPNPDQLKALANEPGMKTVVGESNGWTQLAFNTYGTGTDKTIKDGGPSTTALKDTAFRDALGYAIDKDLLVERVLGGFGVPGNTIIPPVLKNWHVDPAKPRTFDIELAKQKLLDAGYELDASGARLDKEGKPISLRLYFPDTDALYAKTAQFVEDWYGQLGIKVTAQSFDSTTLGDLVVAPEGCPEDDPNCKEYRADYDIELWGWSWNVDPNDKLQIFTCAYIGGSSDSQYCNAEYDKMYEAQAAPDITEAARKPIVAEMQQFIYDEAPYDVLFYDANTAAYRTDKFGGWQTQPLGNGTPFFTYSTLQYTMLTDASAAPSPSAAPSTEPGSSAAPTPAPSGDGGTGTGGDQTLLYVGILAAILVVAGIVLAVVMRRRSAGPGGEEE
jgi:peptide/nickel transport system substrate-binding protein